MSALRSITRRRRAPHRTRILTALVSSVLVLAGIAGCQPRPIDAPLQTALDRGAGTQRRARAVALVPDAAAYELMPLVTSSRHPFPVREAALDRLLAADADRFWPGLTTRIQSVNDWPMLTLLADRAARDKRADAVPALVLSWARPSTVYDDEARPERLAIGSIADKGEPAAVLWAVFAGDGAWDANRRTTDAAWAVLCRTHTRGGLLNGLQDHPDPFGLAELLLAAAPAIDRLPGDREALGRLRGVSAQSRPEDWERRAAIRQRLASDPGPDTLALRHLPLIDRLDATNPDATRAQRLAHLEQRLRAARHVSRGSGDTGHAPIHATPDQISDHADRLGWADLLVIQALLDALADPALAASLFAQAEQDRQDTTTEHGGVLVWDETDNIVARPFSPMLRRHDEEYVASESCVVAMYTGLAHYHFHAQRHDNAAWAGPGGGDFRFADNLHANCVVFTFVDRDTLNVDIYFPGEVVVDLGCVHR